MHKYLFIYLLIISKKRLDLIVFISSIFHSYFTKQIKIFQKKVNILYILFWNYKILFLSIPKEERVSPSELKWQIASIMFPSST